MLINLNFISMQCYRNYYLTVMAAVIIYDKLTNWKRCQSSLHETSCTMLSHFHRNTVGAKKEMCIRDSLKGGGAISENIPPPELHNSCLLYTSE